MFGQVHRSSRAVFHRPSGPKLEQPQLPITGIRSGLRLPCDAPHRQIQMKDSNQPASGMSALPKKWAAAVQLISTFGLAVFLVLYYLFVVRAEEQSRYEKLRASVDALVRINEKGDMLLTADLERRLQEIYVEVASREMADLLFDELKKSPKPEELAQLLRQTLTNRTTLLQGLSRTDGMSLSELLSNKINNFNLPKKLADYALANWVTTERNQIAKESRDILLRELTFIAKAK
jgi:hypothetical protein